MSKKPKLVISADVFKEFERKKIALGSYIEVMKFLHGESFTITMKRFKNILSAKTEAVTFLVLDGKIIATAQASLIMSPPKYHVLVNNVVTHGGYQKRGYGREVMEFLAETVVQKWVYAAGDSVEMMLTNSPLKSNGLFYQSLGWIARTNKNKCPTVVWKKTVTNF